MATVAINVAFNVVCFWLGYRYARWQLYRNACKKIDAAWARQQARMAAMSEGSVNV